MAMCSTWRYVQVTPAVFQKLQALGKQQGFSIPSTPMGSFQIKVAGMQVGFEYRWDSSSATLLLSCVTKPMLVGCATIKGYADRIITNSGGRVG